LNLIFSFYFLIFIEMTSKQYFLEGRTEKFGKSVIKYAKSIKITFYNNNILSQLLKSATSVGANYREANGAESKKDFVHKIAICKKELKETEYWLKMLFESSSNYKELGEPIYKETVELIKLFAKIYSSSIKNKN